MKVREEVCKKVESGVVGGAAALHAAWQQSVFDVVEPNGISRLMLVRVRTGSHGSMAACLQREPFLNVTC